MIKSAWILNWTSGEVNELEFLMISKKCNGKDNLHTKPEHILKVFSVADNRASLEVLFKFVIK